MQGLDDVIHLHNLDLEQDPPGFLLSTRICSSGCCFSTAGFIRSFAPAWRALRLIPGGVLILDNFNHETSPGETKAVRELLPGKSIRSFGFAHQPTGYLIKD